MHVIWIVLLNPKDAQAVLEPYLPADLQFEDQELAKSILTAYEMNYNMPLEFSIDSKDLYLTKTDGSRLLD